MSPNSIYISPDFYSLGVGDIFDSESPLNPPYMTLSRNSEVTYWFICSCKSVLLEVTAVLFYPVSLAPNIGCHTQKKCPLSGSGTAEAIQETVQECRGLCDPPGVQGCSSSMEYTWEEGGGGYAGPPRGGGPRCLEFL